MGVVVCMVVMDLLVCNLWVECGCVVLELMV